MQRLITRRQPGWVPLFSDALPHISWGSPSDLPLKTSPPTLGSATFAEEKLPQSGCVPEIFWNFSRSGVPVFHSKSEVFRTLNSGPRECPAAVLWGCRFPALQEFGFDSGEMRPDLGSPSCRVFAAPSWCTRSSDVAGRRFRLRTSVFEINGLQNPRRSRDRQKLASPLQTLSWAVRPLHIYI